MSHLRSSYLRSMPAAWLILPLALASTPSLAINVGDGDPTGSDVASLKVGQLSFSRCRLDGPQGGLAAQCATVKAPLYPEQPERGEIDLAVAWLPARAERPQPDPLVFLAGGPGQSARQTWPRFDAVLSAVRAERAVLLVDQRGTGASAPLDCAQPDLDAFDASPDDAMLEQFTRDCLAAQSVDPIPFTTDDAVADLERVRAALGIERWNLYGGSYGTRLAQRYAKRHPERVRTLLLDGVVPETLALGSEHGRNLDAALAGQFARCRENQTCREALGDPAELLTQLREQAASEPAPVAVRHPRTAELRELSFSTAILAGTVRLSAYAPETIALLPFGLAEALAGRPQGLMGQAWLLGDSLDQSIAVGLNYSVSCAEDLPRFEAAAEAAEAGTLMGKEMMRSLQLQCAIWPHRKQVPDDIAVPLQGDWPTLLLSGEFDPVTPPRYGEAVLAGLPRGRHLIAPGQGHIVLTRGCTPRLVAEFIDTADAAALDADCLQRLRPPPFFLNYNGAQP